MTIGKQCAVGIKDHVAGRSAFDAALALAVDDECGSVHGVLLAPTTLVKPASPHCSVAAAQLRARLRLGQVALHEETASNYELQREEFERFKAAFGRTYSGDEATVFQIFTSTLSSIKDLNVANGQPVFGLTDAADRSSDELPGRGLKIVRPPEYYGVDVMGGDDDLLRAAMADGNHTVLPESLNWALTRIVTPIKNQGKCNGCWAFVAAEEVESIFNLWGSGIISKFGVEQTFSVQQLLSCAPAPAEGCGGGNPNDAFAYLRDEPAGLVQESIWPFQQGVSMETICQHSSCTKPCQKALLEPKLSKLAGPAGVVLSYKWATPPCKTSIDPDCLMQDLDKLTLSLVMFGPIAVAVNSKTWKYYVGGVLTKKACGSSAMSDMDHAVQLVGFDRRASSPAHWLLRNQWGTAWGDRQEDSGMPTGYIKLEYGTNTCGLANWATIPIVPGFREEGTGIAKPSSLLQGIGSAFHRPPRPERFRRLFVQATSGEAWEASLDSVGFV
eukprot:CAMPEP_0115377736 /NCGR_PEP_ID=MMETSP0271-20121206/3644_1 /TAXON_ID=71861 /ORGANISM="Scrippsiella trochoidea, Strain CCMP3099" /LENGTH=499 /DNA_ID=CAMNT_0002800865 /DNA_START=113 /DNA_END=1610 /DNA_ORIENTATION=-